MAITDDELAANGLLLRDIPLDERTLHVCRIAMKWALGTRVKENLDTIAQLLPLDLVISAFVLSEISYFQDLFC